METTRPRRSGPRSMRRPSRGHVVGEQREFHYVAALVTSKVLIALSGWLVWRQSGFSGAEVAMVLFFGQLALNFLWSAIFFGLQAPGLETVW